MLYFRCVLLVLFLGYTQNSLAVTESQGTASDESSKAMGFSTSSSVPDPASSEKVVKKEKKQKKAKIEKQVSEETKTSTPTATAESPPQTTPVTSTTQTAEIQTASPQVSPQDVKTKPVEIIKSQNVKTKKSSGGHSCEGELSTCLGKKIWLRSVILAGDGNPSIVKLYPEGRYGKPQVVQGPLQATVVYTKKAIACSGALDVYGKVISVRQIEFNNQYGSNNDLQYAVFADTVHCRK